MSETLSEKSERVEELYRCALLVYGRREEALRAVSEALRRLVGKPEAGEPDRAERFLFGRICRFAPRKVEGEGEGVLGVLRRMGREDRSLVGLYYGTGLTVEDISRVLGMPMGELAKRFLRIRQRVAGSEEGKGKGRKMPGKVLPVEWAFFREGQEEREGVPEGLREEVGMQRALDGDCWEAVRRVKVSEEERGELAVLEEEVEKVGGGYGVSYRDPAFWGISLAFLLFVGLVIWLVWGGGVGLEGKRVVVQVLENNRSASPAEYEVVEGDLRDVDDWFALKGIEGVWEPEGFEKLKVGAVRVFPVDGVPVAVALLPEEKVIISFFEGSRMGVSVRPEGSWQMVQVGEDALGVQQRGKVCVSVAMVGTVQELAQELARISGKK